MKGKPLNIFLFLLESTDLTPKEVRTEKEHQQSIDTGVSEKDDNRLVAPASLETMTEISQPISLPVVIDETIVGPQSIELDASILDGRVPEVDVAPSPAVKSSYVDLNVNLHHMEPHLFLSKVRSKKNFCFTKKRTILG